MAVEASANDDPQTTKTKAYPRRRRRSMHVAAHESESQDTATTAQEPSKTPDDATPDNGKPDVASSSPPKKKVKRSRKKATSASSTSAAKSESQAAETGESAAEGAAAGTPAPGTSKAPAAKTRRGGRRKKKTPALETPAAVEASESAPAHTASVEAPSPRAPAATAPAPAPAKRMEPPTLPSWPAAERTETHEPKRLQAAPSLAPPDRRPPPADAKEDSFGAGLLESETWATPPSAAEREAADSAGTRLETPSQKRRRRRRRASAARAAAASSGNGGVAPVHARRDDRGTPTPAAEPIRTHTPTPVTPTPVAKPAGVAVPAPSAPLASSTGQPGEGPGNNRNRRRRKRRRSSGAERPTASSEAPSAEAPPPSDDDGDLEDDVSSDIPAPDIRIWRAPAPGKAGSAKRRSREMIINVTGDDECRIAILANGRLEELFIERQSAQSHVGNIYKGRITNVEPSIQAAFVDFGFPKNGFLHVSDVQPQYFPSRGGQMEAVGKKVPRRDRPPIQRCFRRGQEVIVQITKEGVGTKGPTLTTYLSIPGRFLVMMPGMDKVGLSRKIEDEDARRKMRDVMNQLTFPDNMGFILRTAGMDQSKRELQRDLNYLMRLWKNVSDRILHLKSPAELYQDSDLVTRTLRDVYTTEFEGLVVDHAETARKALDFLQIAAPRGSNNVELYSDTKPIFHAFGIEEQIDLIQSRHVPLPSGGTLVIDSTEAMVAIDVNSGKFRDLDDAEETAYKINMEAAEEIARQLRLRDLGGLIVCDFIDMRFDRHKRAVEKTLREALKKHKERARILRMSQFGLIEMTRQRQRPSIKRGIYTDCPHCRGSGTIKTPESMSLEVMRILQLAAHSRDVYKITLTASPTTALMVLNERRAALHQLQQASGKSIIVQANPSFAPDQLECQCEDSRGRPINFAW